VAQLEAEGRPVTVLDGDVVRTHLSSELTFSREHRDLNIRRIGWVAGEIVRHGGTVVVAAIAPYEDAREEARALVEKHGRFVLVHLSTPLEVCEQRDVKGLYARARAGEIAEFTGVSDPYEPPEQAEVVLDTSATPLEESVSRIRAAMDIRRNLRVGL
jgi:adenylyl-sulfate kinase